MRNRYFCSQKFIRLHNKYIFFLALGEGGLKSMSPPRLGCVSDRNRFKELNLNKEIHIIQKKYILNYIHTKGVYEKSMTKTLKIFIIFFSLILSDNCEHDLGETYLVILRVSKNISCYIGYYSISLCGTEMIFLL